MKRVDVWEAVAAVAMHCGKKKSVRGVSYTLSACSVARNLDQLARLAAGLSRDDTALCNGVSDAAHTEYMARRARRRKRLAVIGAELGVTIEHQTDPRGATIKVWADKVEGRLLACF